MGRYYKGTEAVFLDDKMYKAPYELMGQIIAKKDKEVNDTIDTLSAYSDKLKADVLEEDSPQARAKIQEYQQRIDSAVSGVQADAMNYQQYLPEIKKLSRDITQDWGSTGQMGTMEGYKKEYIKEKEKIDAEVKAGKLDPFIATQEEAKIREKYRAEGGLKWNKLSQRPENKLDIQSQYYKVDFDEKFLQHMKPDEWSTEYDQAKGMYIYTNKNSGKKLSKEDIIRTYMDEVQADTPTLYAAQRYSQLGVNGKDLAGYEGISNTAAAYGYVKKKGKDGKTYDVLETNQGNYWGRKAQAAAEVFEQKASSTSFTMKNNSYAQELEKERRTKAEEVILQTEAEVGSKTNSSNSSAITWNVNNSNLTSLKTELGQLATANGFKQGTKEYTAIMTGDPAYIRGMFTDSATADKYINKYNSINMELNLQKAAITNFNKSHKTKLGDDPSTWSPTEKRLYDQEMSKRETISSQKGNATFNGLGLNEATQKEVRSTVANYVTTGTGNFTTMAGIPSIKYNGAKVRYLDSQNAMYAGALDPSKAVAVSYQGKTLYYPKVSSLTKNGKYAFMVGSKRVEVPPKDVLITQPIAGGEVNLNYYAQQGDLQTSEVLDANGNNVMAFQTMEGGKLVTLSVDQANTAPSWTLNNKKGNYIQSSFKVGSQGIDIQIAGDNINTPSLKKAWDDTYEQRNIMTTKNKFGGSYNASVPGKNGTTYRVENGEYFIDTPTKKGNLITDPAVILEIDKALLYKRN